MKDHNNLLLGIVAVVLLSFIVFYAGQQYQMSKSYKGMQSNSTSNDWMRGEGKNNKDGMMNMNGGGRMGMRPTVGEIVSSDSKSVTIKTTDGSNKVINLSDSTEINKAVTASRSDLKAGERVSIVTETSSDGQITASNIHIGAMVRRMDLN